MTLETKKFTPKSREDGVRISARDLVGSLLLLNVTELKSGVVTKFSPEGSDAIALDVASVETGNVAFDQLWFNGALVDGLADYVGSAVPCRIEWTKSQSSSYSYLTIVGISEADEAAVDKFIAANPNVFDTASSDPSPVAAVSGEAAPAPAVKPRW